MYLSEKSNKFVEEIIVLKVVKDFSTKIIQSG